MSALTHCKDRTMKIASNGIRIHVEDNGAGDLPIVFLHYWGGSSRTWRHITSELKQSHRTIATDHRGWGQSDAPASGYNLTDLAADAQGVIDALGLQRYVLVGHSMGGKVAQLLASRRPSGLAGLVLVAPSPPSPMQLPLEARQGMVAAYASRASIITTVTEVLTAKALSADDLETVVQDTLRGATSAKTAWPLVMSQEDITAHVGAIDVPTIVIGGELDRVDSIATLQAEVLPRIPHAVLHHLQGTGHLSMLESPNTLAQIILDFAGSLRFRSSAATAAQATLSKLQ